MRKAFEISHVAHLGMGGSRAKGHGGGCNCKINLIRLPYYQHDIFDRRATDRSVEIMYTYIKDQYREQGYTLNQIWKIAFGRVYGGERKIIQAIEHNLLRRRNKTVCSKWKGAGA